ncbi:30S ribosomal protein S13 [Candidatus Shapirobacteria bacterium RBG_13_44_7]|uniref:Small ribosomal subunit protein uS13 n=1 Tax=Candidatus Shapirobacteria bacterium RBG_13_44_7 TaxID=1802149 RepID=A0A1F7SIG1_9BACT|nr:MAG: 30S ribosomal protein S13 [Candidatus Shapirobacteria bacterium RBG_13_44_7]
MRISGVDIPDHERAEIGLTRFYGIGRTNVTSLLKKAKISPDTRIKDLSRDDIGNLMKALEEFMVEGDLKKEIRDNIERLRAIKCYRGIRHIVGLPVRGQKTRSNARTRKGRKKTVGSLTKEAWAKIETQQKAATIAKNS